MKKYVIGCILIILMILEGCSAPNNLVSSNENVINTKEELYQKVQSSLKEGKTEISFEIKDLQQEDFDQLNLEHDGFYGNVDKYQIKTIKFLDYSYVTLYCNISDNYYVEESILTGGELPEERKKANELKNVCEQVLADMKGLDTEYQKEKKIHDFIVNNVSYGFPDENEKEDSDAYNSYGALVKGKAVCNGYAQAMKLLCDLAGLECRMVTGTADGESHAWNLICLEDEWYHTDVTWDDPKPDDPSRILYSYFNLNDSAMKFSHDWEIEAYPKARGVQYNYYEINDLYCENYEMFKEKCSDIFSHENPDHIQILVGDYDEKIYSEERMQFLFQYSGASSINLQTIGTGEYMTLYITLQYD